MSLSNARVITEYQKANRKVILALIEEDDIKHLIKLAKDPELIDAMGWETSFSSDDVDGFVEALAAYALPFSRPSEPVVLGVFLETEPQPIGYGVLKGFNMDLLTTETGVAILDRRYRNKGYGRLTLQGMVTHAFNELNIKRIGAAILASNKTSINMCKRSGFFVKEIMTESWNMPNGDLVDMVWMEVERGGVQE
ncbi:MAG: GNAT family N-acetyltransferase [Cyanobacteria bacterium P01_F01_bin.150]